jgi:DNA-binding SARP family transcriptional activator
VTVAVLGPAEIQIGGDRRLRSAHKRTVLAALALDTGREVTIERLIDLVWGTSPPRTAAHALRVYASELRSLLGEAASGLVTTTSGYRFEPSIVTTDIDDLVELVGVARSLVSDRHLEESAAVLADALRLWRGIPFTELGDDDRAVAERARLAALRAEIHDELTDARLELGQHAELLPELEGRINAEPFRERPYLQLMTALARLGRRSDALSVSQRARQVLSDQLGVDPGPALRELEARLRQQPDVVTDGPARGDTTIEALRARPFVGRAAELEWLTAMADHVAAGTGTLVLIAGEPGLGKTRLVDEFVAGLGWPTWRARCPNDRGVPTLWPLIDALRRADGFAERVRDDGRLRPLRELMGGAPTRRTDTALGDAPDGFGLHQALAETILALVDRPRVLVLDDLHWADTGTLGTVVRLATIVDRVPLLIVATHRTAPVDRSDAFDRTLGDLVRERTVSMFDLPPLDATDVVTYVSRIGLQLDDERLARLVERCDGNALFLTELVRLIVERGEEYSEGLPRGLADTLSTRVAQTGRAAEVLARAALIGIEFGTDVLCRLGGATRREITEALALGVHHGLLTAPTAGTFRFTHALVVDAAAGCLDDTVRREVHLRIAEVLATRPGLDPARRTAEIARHRMAALPLGDTDAAAKACIDAGEQELAAYAYAEAAAQFAAARHACGFGAASTTTARALVGEAEALMAAGRNSSAHPLLDEALALLDPVSAPELFALAVRVLVLQRSAAGAGGDARLANLLEQAIAGLCGRHDWLAVQLRTDLAMLHYRTDPSTCEQLGREALAISRSGGDAIAVSFALTGLHQAIWGPSSLPERLELATEAISAARRTGLEWQESMAWSFRAADRWEHGDLAGVAADLARATELGIRARRPRFIWIARSWQALLDLATGETARAEEGFAAALAAWGPEANPDATMCFVAQQLTVRMLSGDTSDIVALLSDAAATESDPLLWHALLSYPLVLAGDLEGANRSLDVMVDGGLERLRPDVSQLAALAMMSEAAAALKRDDVATPVAALLAPYGDRRIVMNVYGGGGLWWGTVAHQLGLCATTIGNTDDARRWFVRAGELHERDRTPVFTERSRQALALVTASAQRPHRVDQG